MTKRKAFLGVAAGVAFLAVLGLLLVPRKVEPPEFIKAREWELFDDAVSEAQPWARASVSHTFNVRRDVDALMDDCLNSGTEFDWKLGESQYGYTLVTRSKNSPIKSIFLTSGRMHYGRSFNTDDHKVPADFGDGWTIVTVDYRPNWGASLRSWWEWKALPAVGIEPKSKGVAAAIGMRLFPPPGWKPKPGRRHGFYIGEYKHKP